VTRGGQKQENGETLPQAEKKRFNSKRDRRGSVLHRRRKLARQLLGPK